MHRIVWGLALAFAALGCESTVDRELDDNALAIAEEEDRAAWVEDQLFDDIAVLDARVVWLEDKHEDVEARLEQVTSLALTLADKVTNLEAYVWDLTQSCASQAELESTNEALAGIAESAELTEWRLGVVEQQTAAQGASVAALAAEDLAQTERLDRISGAIATDYAETLILFDGADEGQRLPLGTVLGVRGDSVAYFDPAAAALVEVVDAPTETVLPTGQSAFLLFAAPDCTGPAYQPVAGGGAAALGRLGVLEQSSGTVFVRADDAEVSLEVQSRRSIAPGALCEALAPAVAALVSYLPATQHEDFVPGARLGTRPAPEL